MKKNDKKISLAKEKYYVLMWDKKDIVTFLAFPKLDQAVFNFNKSSGKYKMSVTGFDADGKWLGASVLNIYAKLKEADLDNLYPGGLFFLAPQIIISNSVNGAKSLYFVPKPYIVNPTLQYVSYDVYDDEPPAIAPLIHPLSLVNSINPSPPYGR